MECIQDIVITGIIMPNNWDENGKVIEIALYTDNEEIYALEDNCLTGELIRLLRKKIEIKGKFRKHPDGKTSISAHNYIVLDETVNKENAGLGGRSGLGGHRAESDLQISSFVRLSIYAKISQIRCTRGLASCHGPGYRTEKNIR
jgi:hypothetical protein